MPRFSVAGANSSSKTPQATSAVLPPVKRTRLSVYSDEDDEPWPFRRAYKISSSGKNGDLAQPLRYPSVSCVLLDSDVLDCPICFMALNPPVYECVNGHVACESCCTNMKNKCGSCSMSIGYNRCRAFEKVIESLEFKCSNYLYGCWRSLKNSERLCHEERCTYIPCSCPYCHYKDSQSDLYTHFQKEHASSVNKIRFGVASKFSVDGIKGHIVLVEEDERFLFVLSRSVKTDWNSGYVVCIAPTTSGRDFVYELSAEDADSSTKLTTTVENTPKWAVDHKPKKQFVVLKEFMASEWKLTIWNKDEDEDEDEHEDTDKYDEDCGYLSEGDDLA